jgi:hypothetical protein
MQTLSADALFPEWRVWNQYIEDDLDAARSLDGLRSSHPVQVPIPKAEDVEEVFDAISYCKGSCIVRLLYHVMGPDAFRDGIRDYMKKHAYGNTVTDDLWNALQPHAKGVNIRALMDSWTKQTGYPVLQVSLPATNNTTSIKVRQEYFVSDGSVLEGDESLVWMVPVFIQKPDGTKFMHILSNKEEVIDLGESHCGWFKVNSGEIAPIRVQYMDENLRTNLLRQGIPNLPVIDRVGILSDIRALSKAGKASLNDVIDVVRSFANDHSVDVWESIESTLTSIERVVGGLGLSTEFESFVCGLVVPRLAQIGTDTLTTDSESDKRLRSCLYRLVSQFGHSVTEAAGIRKDAIRRCMLPDLPDDIRASIFKLGLSAIENEDGGRMLWEHLISIASNPQTDQSVCLDIYAAAGYVGDSECKKSTLEWSLSVKIQDFMYPIGSVRKSGIVGAGVCWEWLIENFSRCQDRVAKANPSLLASVVVSACGGSVDAERAAEIESRFGHLPSIKRNVAQLVEGIRSNAEYVDRSRSFVL